MRSDEYPVYDLPIEFFEDIGHLSCVNGIFRITLFQVHDTAQGQVKVPIRNLACTVNSVPGFINSVIKATWNNVTYGPQMEVLHADRIGRH